MEFSEFLLLHKNSSGAMVREPYLKKHYPKFFLKIDSLDAPSFFHKLFKFFHGTVPICKSCGSVLSKDMINIKLGTSQQYCSRKCANSNPAKIQKTKDTCFDKYGESNPMKNSKIRDAVLETHIKKYGCHALGNKVIRNKISKTRNDHINDINKLIQESRHMTFKGRATNKIKDHFLLIEYTSYSDVYVQCKVCNTKSHIHLNDFRKQKEKTCKTCFPRHKSSYYEYVLSEFLNQHYKIETNKRSIFSNKRKEIDILLTDINVGIEINGLRWHTSNRLGDDYHFNKTKEAMGLGIELVHFFTDDFDKFGVEFFSYISDELVFSGNALITKDNIIIGRFVIHKDKVSFIHEHYSNQIFKFLNEAKNKYNMPIEFDANFINKSIEHFIKDWQISVRMHKHGSLIHNAGLITI